MDYSKKKGDYTYELDRGRKQIDSWHADPELTVSGYISKVEQLIAPAYINVTAKPRFLAALRSQTTKDGILFLCYNSIMSAQGFAVG